MEQDIDLTRLGTVTLDLLPGELGVARYVSQLEEALERMSREKLTLDERIGIRIAAIERGAAEAPYVRSIAESDDDRVAGIVSELQGALRELGPVFAGSEIRQPRLYADKMLRTIRERYGA